MNTDDFHRHFRAHPEAFEAADTLGDFASRIGGKLGELMARYAAPGGWANLTFEAAKVHGYMPAPLHMPRARTFADLFEAAAYLPQVQTKDRGTYTEGKPPGFFLVSGHRAGDAAPSGTHGGSRYVVAFKDGTAHRGRKGARFFLTYAKPRPEVLDVWSGYYGAGPHGGGLGHFKAIGREDGILIIAEAANLIGSIWLALLKPGESLVPMMPEESRQLIKAERAADAAEWACIVKREDGREYLDESRCTVPVERR